MATCGEDRIGRHNPRSLRNDMTDAGVEQRLLSRQYVEGRALAGFRLALVLPGYFERKLGRMLQFDGVFIRQTSDRTRSGSSVSN